MTREQIEPIAIDSRRRPGSGMAACPGLIDLLGPLDISIHVQREKREVATFNRRLRASASLDGRGLATHVTGRIDHSVADGHGREPAPQFIEFPQLCGALLRP